MKLMRCGHEQSESGFLLLLFFGPKEQEGDGNGE